jgi:hypothetical protein
MNYPSGAWGFANPSEVITNIVIIEGDNGHLLMYSGTPAAGNLIYSIANNNFFDSFGNLIIGGGAASYLPVSGGTSFATLATTGGMNFYTGGAAGAGPWDESFSFEQVVAGAISLFGLSGGNQFTIGNEDGTIHWIFPSGDTTGVTDYTNIMGIMSASAGLIGTSIFLMPGKYYTVNNIVPVSWSSITGQGTILNNSFLSDFPTTIVPGSSYASTGAKNALILCDGSTEEINGFSLINVNLDGTDGPGTIDGVDLFGNVNGILMRDFCINNMTGSGFQAIVDGGNLPDGLRMNGGMVSDCTGFGFFYQAADVICWDLHPSNNGLDGFRIITCANSIFNACRSASNFNRGWNFGADEGAADPTGFIVLNACNSQLNIWDGLYVDWPADGGQQLVFNSFQSLGDGINLGAGGGGFGGVNIVSAIAPISFSNLSVIPSSTTTSPQYGLTYTDCTSLNIDGGSIQGYTTAYNNGGGNGFINISHYTTFFTGSPTAPVVSLYNEWNYVGAAGQPAFGSGWSNVGSGNAQLGFARNGQNRLRIRGYVANGTAANTNGIFTLPAGYRPASQQIFPAVENGTVYGNSIVVQTGGEVNMFASAGAGDYDVNCDVSLSI